MPKVSKLAHGKPELKPGGGVARGTHPAPMYQHGSCCLNIPELWASTLFVLIRIWGLENQRKFFCPDGSKLRGVMMPTLSAKGISEDLL